MTWSEKDIEQSLSSGNCLICKKIKLAKEMGIALSLVEKDYLKRGLLCVECFERDIYQLSNIDEHEKEKCGICFVCEEKFENVPYDASETENTYTFEIIGDRTKDNSIFCLHIHKDCYEASADEQWIFDGKRNRD